MTIRLSEQPGDELQQAVFNYPELARFTAPERSDEARVAHAEHLRRAFLDVAAILLTEVAPGRERAVALTELETAMMWGVKAVHVAGKDRK